MSGTTRKTLFREEGSEVAAQDAASVRRWEVATLAIILLVGLSLRGLYLRELLNKPDFTVPAVDAGFHDYWARALAFGDWRPPFDFPDPQIRRTAYLRPPGYPYFLSLVYTVCGRGYVAPRVVQMGLGLLSAVIAWAAIRRWLGPVLALIVAALMATYWIFIYFEGEFHSVVLVVYLSWLIVYFAGAWAEQFRVRHTFIAGVLVGVTGLVLPNALVYLPVLIAWAWWMARRGPDQSPQRERRVWPAATALVAGTAVAVAPATIRNYMVSRDFVLISNNAGINLFIGNSETASGLVADRIADLGDFKTCFDYPALLASLEHQEGRPLKPSEVSRYFTAEALRFILEHPGRFLELTALKAWLFWGPREVLHNKVIRYERESSPVLRSIPLNFSVIVILALIGLVASLQHRNAASPHSRPLVSRSPCLLVLMAAFTLAYFLAVLPFFAAARYRVPVIPFLVVLAAVALHRFGRMLAAREIGRAALAAGVAAVLVFAHVLARDVVPEGGNERAKWHFDRAIAYNFSGRIEPAIAEYREVLARMPENPVARMGLGVSLAKLGRTEEAIEHFTAALAAWPDFQEARFNLAVGLFQTGRLPEAEAHFREIMRLAPANPEVRCNLAVVLTRQGRTTEAAAEYQAVLRMYPGYPRAREALAELPSRSPESRPAP